MTLQQLLNRIDSLKAKLDSARPLGAGELSQLREYYKIGLTYASNALEGNSLTEIETKVVIEDGLTVGGKPLRDHLEAAGHAEAYDRMVRLAQGNAIVEGDILTLHRLFYRRLDAEQAGVYRNQQVWISGSEFVPPASAKVPALMRRLFKKMPKVRRETHSVSFAAWLHLELATIHPFVDGNGRVARLAMNLALLQDGYPVTIIPPLRRMDYLLALQREQTRRVKEDRGDSFEFFVAECALDSLADYTRMLNSTVPRP
ncbi:MAG: Fic family protein [Blastocatellia bacterium]